MGERLIFRIIRRLFSLTVAASVAAPAMSAQGRIVVDTLRSQALRGNLIGDTPDREITVYVPPSYARDTTKRYPVVYLLHGVTSHPREWLDGSYDGFDLRAAMDSLIAAGMSEYIIAMPFADNRFGGSFYVNSAAFGRWEDFIATELVRWVDSRFRTDRDRRRRILAGQSMGGFGAIAVGGRHAESFGRVYAMSPCCLGFVGELAPESDAWTSGKVRWIDALEAAFAPAGAERTTPAPFIRDSLGGIREVAVVARAWRQQLPLERLSVDAPEYAKLCAIAIEFGSKDHIASVRIGAPAFAAALRDRRVRVTVDEFDGGHVDRVRERFTKVVLPYFGRAFASAC